MSRKNSKADSASGESRLKRYVEIEKVSGKEGSHPAVKALHERPATRSGSAKVREYARIERGQEA